MHMCVKLKKQIYFYSCNHDKYLNIDRKLLKSIAWIDDTLGTDQIDFEHNRLNVICTIEDNRQFIVIVR